MRTVSLLIIDDEPDAVDIQGEILSKAGYDVLSATSTNEGMKMLESHFVDLLLLDERVGPERGTDMLRECRTLHPGLGGIIISGHMDLDLAVTAMRVGALDMLIKPITRETLIASVEQALADSEIVRDARFHIWQSSRDPIKGIIGENKELKGALEHARLAAPTPAPILILGESGTGKEVVARAIHAISPRRNHRFVAVNLAAIPSELRESALFGHRKGAFTGAISDQSGHFQAAHGGTLFLDEIGDATPALQGSLLRAIQEKEIVRVGDTTPLKVNVRIIAATNRDLLKEVETKAFRQDLYYRLAVMTLTLPPLRERIGDIPALAKYLAEKHAASLGKPIYRFSPDALQRLQAYDWPGNVRELENVIQRAIILTKSGVITPDVLSLNLPDSELDRGDYQQAREKFDRAYFSRLLDLCDQDKTKAASVAGINRSTLYDHLHRLKLA